jgi:hypothetical protein
MSERPESCSGRWSWRTRLSAGRLSQRITPAVSGVHRNAASSAWGADCGVRSVRLGRARPARNGQSVPNTKAYCRRSPRTNESVEHPSDLHVGGSAGDYSVARSKGALFVLVLGFDDTEAPRSRVIEHWAEHEHLA